MNKIIEHLYQHPILKQMTHHVSQNENIYINNTNEDNALLVLLALYKKLNKTFFLITPNLYTAQLVYDKLSLVLKDDEVFFFPQDEFLTNELLVSSNEFRLERINTIEHLLQNKPKIVVANLYGILKPQLSKQQWLSSFF